MGKGLFMLPMLATLFVLTGCSNDDGEEQEAKIEVMKNEIQGSWHNSSYSLYRHITFEGNNYSYDIMDINEDEFTHREHGIYTINGINIIFVAEEKNTKLGSCEIYWDNESKNYLHIYPIGLFIKAN